MSELTIAPIVPGTNFDQLVDTINWENDTPLDQLRVIPEIGSLALVNEADHVTHLLGFTDRGLHNPVIEIPASLSDLPPNRQNFNGDSTAKGLGTSTTNTPEALFRKDNLKSIIAVRSVALSNGLEDIYVAHNSEAFPAQAGRWLRHGILYAGAEALDIISRSHQGTEAAMRFMERPYGDKQVAVLPAPPSWRAAQAHAGIEHTTSPHKVLVRGRGLNTELPLRGIYPTSSLHHK